MGLAASEQPILPSLDSVRVRRKRSVGRKQTIDSQRRPRRIDSEVLAALADPAQVIFLDVETTGLSRHYDELTLVGWMIDGVHRVYVAGDDPSALLSSLEAASALVTFNGTLFDLPFLRKAFLDLQTPKIHADLRFLGRRAGLTGGQKAIEEELRISVRNGVEDLDGAQAVLLWHRYLRGDTHSLRRLIDYNRCDVIAMTHILDKVLEKLVVDPDFWFSQSAFSRRPCVMSGWAVPDCQLPPSERLRRPKKTFASLFSGTVAENATVVGIDLTGSEVRPSGWCILRGAVAETDMVATDDEMVARVLAASPAVVSIDSPLSLPFGRTRVEDDDPSRAEFGIMRRCERELKRRGINVYPCLLPSMQRLTRRGMQLAERLRKLGFPVIESYPGAAQDIIGIPRKGAGAEFLKQGLAEFGICGKFTKESVRHDELDAITSALVGAFFLAGKYEALSGPSEGALIIPDLKAPSGPVVVGISGRICAGKTTAAGAIEQLGFAYTRFSLVIDEEIRQRGQEPDRESRQRVGQEISETKGQRWLCERVLARVSGSRLIVVDGLRFFEDRAFLIERFGTCFLHLHISAPAKLRKKRFGNESADGLSFEDADGRSVEREIDGLGRMAHTTIKNVGAIHELEAAVQQKVSIFLHSSGQECPSPRSH